MTSTSRCPDPPVPPAGDRSNVVNLDTPEYGPNQVALDLLRCCELGEVEAAFVVIRQRNGTMRSWWTKVDPGALLCASTILRFDAEELLAREPE